MFKACLVLKNGVSTFSFSLFYIQILELNIEKKHLFLHLVVFGKLFWMHNLGIEYIITEFGNCFLLLKKSNFSH